MTQDQIKQQLRQKLNLDVPNTWNAFQGFKNHYSPRTDIAAGPFSIIGGRTKSGNYNALLRDPNVDSFLRELYNCHCYNVRTIIGSHASAINEVQIPTYNRVVNTNRNARCFLAFEFENKNSRKHVLGSIINACALGRIAIGVGVSEVAFKVFITQLNYLSFIKRAKMIQYEIGNFLVISNAQLETAINNIP